jgi:hypothetical protein
MGGVANLFRIHGSAVYKVVLPSLVSTGILIGYHFITFSGKIFSVRRDSDEKTIVQHPFAIGAFISFFRYAVVFDCWFAIGSFC